MTTEQYAIEDGMTREQFAALYPECGSTFVGPIHPEKRLEYVNAKCGHESGHLAYPSWDRTRKALIEEIAKTRPLTGYEKLCCGVPYKEAFPCPA